MLIDFSSDEFMRYIRKHYMHLDLPANHLLISNMSINLLVQVKSVKLNMKLYIDIFNNIVQYYV